MSQCRSYSFHQPTQVCLKWANQQWRFVQETQDLNQPMRQIRRQTSKSTFYQGSSGCSKQKVNSFHSNRNSSDYFEISPNHTSRQILQLVDDHIDDSPDNVEQESDKGKVINSKATEIISGIEKQQSKRQEIRGQVVRQLRVEKKKLKKRLIGNLNHQELEQIRLINTNRKEQFNLDDSIKILTKDQISFLKQKKLEEDSKSLERHYKLSSIPLPVLFSRQISYQKQFNYANFPPYEKNTYSLIDGTREKSKEIFSFNEKGTMNDTQMSSIMREVDDRVTSTYGGKFVTMAQSYLKRSNDLGKDKIQSFLDPLFQAYQNKQPVPKVKRSRTISQRL